MSKSLILIGKKTYVLVRNDGKVKSRGVCLSRKDKLPIMQKLYKHCVEIASTNLNIETKRKVIATMLRSTIKRINEGKCQVWEISEIKRMGGNMCYCYKGK